MSRVTKIACWLLPWFPIVLVTLRIVDAYERAHPRQLTTQDWMRMSSPDGPLPPSLMYEIVVAALAVSLVLFLIGLIILCTQFMTAWLRHKRDALLMRD